MITRRRLIVATAVAVAVAVPAVVLAGNGNFLTSDVDQQETRWTLGKHTAPKNWTTVPEVGDLGVSPAPRTVIVSAEMARGRAKFRVRIGGVTRPPGPVLFAAKGSGSFSWAYNAECPEPQSLEWKRAGNRRAVAARVSTIELDELNICA